MSLTSFALAEMQIRRPVSVVFDAFTDPAVTTRFWFTKSTGPLLEGGEITWTWEMYNFSLPIRTLTLEAGKRLRITWGEGETVEWTFRELADGSTFVSVRNDGISADDPETLAGKIRNSTEGFTLVLAGAKAWLEHSLELNLVRDRFPEGLS